MAVSHFDPRRHGYFGADVGGTLAKVMFYEPDNDTVISKVREFVLSSTTYGSTGQRDTQLTVNLPKAKLHFILFETSRMHQAIKLIRSQNMLSGVKSISVTGGGAFKFSELVKDELGCLITKRDEMYCLIHGLNFLLRNVSNEVYYFVEPEDDTNEETAICDVREEMFPYLLVNLGTGVSILKVSGWDDFERVSGSGLGGGTYYGLCRLLTQAKDFKATLDEAVKGDGNACNMTVGDIYGGSYGSLGLDANMTASFFGKVTMEDSYRENIKEADICKALLYMVTNNVGQIAYLNARLQGLKNIYFAGNFLRTNKIAMKYLSKAIHFWSGGEMKALFLHHEGFFGACGAFLDSDQPNTCEPS
ncbi:pantothenate kinase 1 [Basidiobolus meristosporus CBS 931.73]|uniref:pantothenate kinase n=1 Tax=Basidiobolus meristosporus CBS 931.73 TaxID=1314790 RepID=A0A1Y1XL42_9FUNG|nr:pantothenate kinase 1 [Basidiobolus meristosporus CBS 931.73]|eukprot:ORX86478.1 pantothenate kinase 1 [Basidiobolus meristosporus CBS 931.73]